MTMIATVLGGRAAGDLASGAGAEARQALGWIIVGGLGFAAVSTLFLTPVAYLLLARFSVSPRSHEEERLETRAGGGTGRCIPDHARLRIDLSCDSGGGRRWSGSCAQEVAAIWI